MKKLVIVCTLLLICFCTSAQISGPSSVTVGTANTYYYSNGSVVTSPWWSVGSNGTILSTWQSGPVYFASVKWNTVGASSLTFLGNNYQVLGQVNVTASCPEVSTPSATFTYTNACSSTTISYLATPPAGITWYWQTSASGTSTSNSSNSIVVTTNGTYYLRANCGNTWSGTLATTAVNIQTLTSPTTTNVNTCTTSGGPVPVLLNATPGTNGNAIRWYSVSTGGSVLATGNTYSTTASLGTTVYFASTYNSTTGCESARYPAIVNVSSIPDVAVTPQASALFSSQSTNILLTNPNNTPSTILSWTVSQTNVSGATSGSGTNISQALTASTGSGTVVYTITPSVGVCVGSSVMVTVSVYPFPVITAPQDRIAKGLKVGLMVGSGYDTYTWKNSAGTILGNDQIYEANGPDTYEVTVTKGGTSASVSYTLLDQLAGLNENYVISNQVLVPHVTDPSVVNTLRVEVAQQTIQYFDGLGRPMQTVITQGSPSKQDIVQPIAYDAFGRETVKYLPYVSGNTGWYQDNFLPKEDPAYATLANPHYKFYQTTSKVSIDTKPYAETLFEASPLNRILEQGAPGSSWQPDATDDYTSTDRTIKKGYEFNLANEVRMWKYAYPTEAAPLGIITGTGTKPYYDANQLYKNKTKDEEHHEIIEYVDKEGRTVLKRVQVSTTNNAPTTDANKDTNWASTYYVYDDLGNLVCVVPPEASKILTSTVIPFTWASLTGITASSADHTLTKTAVTSYTNSGAYYATALPANTSGWVRMVAGETNTSRMIGLTTSNAGTNTNITFALELASDGHVYVWEDNVKKNDLGVYTTGSSVMISRENGYVKYYVNDVHKLTSSKTTSSALSTAALYVDVTINETGGTLKDVDISWSSEKTTLANFAFYYAYDGRKRMTHKKVPGASPVYMVYDKRDRLVMTQDGNQRTSKQWLFTKYDALNRPVLTGIYTADSTLVQSKMQRRVDAYYGALATNNGAWFESFVGSSGVAHGYDNKSYPLEATANNYLTVTYYDNYNFKSLWPAGYDYETDNLSETVNGYTYTQPENTSYNQRVIGQVTGSKTKVLDGINTWLKAVTYYDDKYRVIQNKADNYKAGIDRVSNLYDFTGKVLKTKTSYKTYDVTWQNVVEANVLSGNLVRSLSGSGWNQCGAISAQQLAAGTDGWIEMVVTQPASNRRRMIGLADTNPDLHYTSMDYAFYVLNWLYVYENGTQKYQAPGNLVEGDVIRIERVGTTVKYYRNGILLYTSATPSSTNLFVDASIYDVGAPITSLKTSFSLEQSDVNRRFSYDHAGRLISTYHKLGNGELVNWSSLTAGLAFDGTKLAATTGGWTTGAFSTQSIPANTDGWIEFPAYEVSKNKMIGLSDVNTNANYTTIDYAWYLTGSSLAVYESGTSKGTVGTFTANDVLRIERINGVVYYKKNGTILYTSQSTLTTSSTVALFADCSFSTATGGNIYAAYMGTGLGYSEVEIARNEYNELGQLVDKKVHLHPGTVHKQSVDYRYNIRGWLTSINNADLTTISAINDETTDYFGMNLSYDNVDTDLGNAQLYNGNISAMKWSNYPGTGLVKQKGYTYKYDPMNRILGSFYQEKGASWAEPSNNGFDERGFTYDLNGNITKLTRFDKSVSGFMDSLSYNYGSGASQGNKLWSVTDNGDDFKGFKDGNASGNDYNYDANGNMTVDLNKGISAITYNHLNLPYQITKGSNTITYLYDATGRKLAQVVNMNGTTKQTDYAGEFVYENDVLQFVSHEEGRIVTASTKLIYTNPCETTTDFSSANATISTVTLNGTEKYVQLVSAGTTIPSGAATMGGGFPVMGGEQYKIRIKGYHTNTSTTVATAYPVTLRVQVDGVNVTGAGARLPKGIANDGWVEAIVTIPGNATQKLMQVGMLWQGTTALNETMLINEVEIVQLLNTAPEYQYNLKDHLGNTRLTFTTKQETISEKATMETANESVEAEQFLYYDEAKKVNEPIFDKTNGTTGTYFATRLTGGATNAIYGLAKSISVMPGDVVNMEVYAKYVDTNAANWTAALTTLMTGIANGTAAPGVSIDGGAAGSLGGGNYPFAPLNHSSETGTPPKAYLNYIMFNKDMTTVLGSGYQRITTNSREYGQDVAHDRLALTYTVKEPGYMYIYLSNENPTAVEVYFDDFKVDHVKSPIVQVDDYYPFGLTFNSYKRENSVENRIKFQGQEHIDDLNLGWDSFKWRNHQPDIGRFFNVDPLAEKYVYNSPYAFSENRVVNAIELEGLEALIVNTRNRSAERTRTATGDQVTSSTVATGLTHPIAVSQVGQVEPGSTNISSVSGRIGRHMAEGGNMTRGDGGEENGFRHALWSATITNRFGPDAALRITNAHEGIGPFEKVNIDFTKPLVQKTGLADGIVDILNNAIGQDIASNLPENASPTDIAAAVLNVQRNEGLWTVSTDKDGNISISRQKISQKQFDQASQQLSTLDNNGFNEADRKSLEEKDKKK